MCAGFVKLGCELLGAYGCRNGVLMRFGHADALHGIQGQALDMNDVGSK